MMDYVTVVLFLDLCWMEPLKPFIIRIYPSITEDLGSSRNQDFPQSQKSINLIW